MQQETQIQNDTLAATQELKEPIDLGREFYEAVCKDFIKLRGVEPTNFVALSNFCRDRFRKETKDFQANVNYTLNIYHQLAMKDLEIKRKLEKALSDKINTMEAAKAKQKKQALINSLKTKLTMTVSKQEDFDLIEWSDSEDFVGEVIGEFKKKNPDDPSYFDVSSFKEFYTTNMQKKKGIPADQFEQNLKRYLMKRLEVIFKMFHKAKGVWTYDPQVMYVFFRDDMRADVKEKLGLQFESSKTALKHFKEFLEEKKRIADEKKKQGKPIRPSSAGGNRPHSYQRDSNYSAQDRKSVTGPAMINQANTITGFNQLSRNPSLFAKNKFPATTSFWKPKPRTDVDLSDMKEWLKSHPADLVMRKVYERSQKERVSTVNDKITAYETKLINKFSYQNKAQNLRFILSDFKSLISTFKKLAHSFKGIKHRSKDEAETYHKVFLDQAFKNLSDKQKELFLAGFCMSNCKDISASFPIFKQIITTFAHYFQLDPNSNVNDQQASDVEQSDNEFDDSFGEKHTKKPTDLKRQVFMKIEENMQTTFAPKITKNPYDPELTKKQILEETMKKHDKEIRRAYIKGIYKKALVHFHKENYIIAYKDLSEQINLKKLKNSFKDRSKLDSESPLLILFTKSSEIDEEFYIPEDQFSREVYELIKSIEKVDANRRKVKQKGKHDKNEDDEEELKSANNDDFEFGHKPSKRDKSPAINELCPLKHECDDLACELIHNPYQLKVTITKSAKPQQPNSLKNRKAASVKNNHDHLTAPEYWRQTANPLRNCKGCGHKNCYSCKFKKEMDGPETNSKTNTRPASTAHKNSMNSMADNSQADKKQSSENYINEFGLLRRAEILFAQKKLSEAMQVILKAISKTRELLDKQREKEIDYEHDLKEKLSLPADAKINEAFLYRLRIAKEKRKLKCDDDDSMDVEDDLSQIPFAKALLFVEKMKKRPLNAKLEVLKSELDLLFKKVKKAIEIRDMGIKCMEKRLEKLEQEEKPKAEQILQVIDGEDEMRRERLKFDKNKLCPKMGPNKPCPDIPFCLYAHNPTELNVIPRSSKIAKLEQAIKRQRNSQIKKEKENKWVPGGKPPLGQKGLGPRAHKLEMDIQARREIAKGENIENSEFQGSTKPFRNIWEQNDEDLQALVFGRKDNSF